MYLYVISLFVQVSLTTVSNETKKFFEQEKVRLIAVLENIETSLKELKTKIENIKTETENLETDIINIIQIELGNSLIWK